MVGILRTRNSHLSKTLLLATNEISRTGRPNGRLLREKLLTMKYEISYNHMTEGQLKRDKAIQDIKNYCTPKQYNTLWAIAMETTRYGTLSFYCDFAGISGYPVVALWDEARQTMRDMTN